MVERTSAET